MTAHASVSRYFVVSVTNDYVLAEGSSKPTAMTVDPIRVGGNASVPAGGRNAVFIFPLPRLGPLTNLVSASVAFTVKSSVGTPAFNADLWAIGIRSNTAPLMEYCQADTDSGDPSNVKLQDNLISGTVANDTVLVASNAVLRTYLQNFYSSHPDYAGGQFVFLRVNPDSAPGAGNDAWNIGSGDGIAPPVLTLFMQNTNAPDSSKRPNFVIMIADDQRYDAAGFVQREQGATGRFPWFTNGTPGLDRLAASGMNFRNAFVVQSVCSPSRAAMLTGLYNHINGVQNNSTRFPLDAVNFAQTLRERGYRTGYFGKYHMTRTMIERPGFDDTVSFIGHGHYTDVVMYRDGLGQTNTGWVDDLTAANAMEFLEANQTNHFAMVVGFKSPHSPFTPPPRNANLYANEKVIGVPSLGKPAPYRTNQVIATDATKRNYFRCITSMDENVSRLLDKLDALNLSSNTVVVFISDNGNVIDEHGMTMNKWSSYEASIRTLFLMRYPPLTAASRTNDAIVLNIDLMPTLLELAGLTVPTNLMGRSLVPLLSGATPTTWRKDFLYENFRDTPANLIPIQFAVRNATNKFVMYPGRPDWTELFNHAADPHETNNLANVPAFSGLRSAMNARLHELLDETGLTAQLSVRSRNSSNYVMTVRGGIGPIYRVTTTTNLQAQQPKLQFKMQSLERDLVITNTALPAEQYRLEMLSD